MKFKLYFDEKRLSRLLKESAWIFFGQIMGVIGSLALVRQITGYLLPTDYGLMSLALTLGTLVCQVSLSGVMPGIMRFYTLAVEQDDVRNFTKDSLRLMCYGTAGTILLGMLIVSGVSFTDYSGWLWCLLLAIAFTQVNSYGSTLNSIQNSARQRNIVALHGAIDPWVKICMVEAFQSDSIQTPEIIIFAYFSAASLVLTSQLFFFNRLVKRATQNERIPSTPWLNKMFNYSKPFIIFNLPTWAQVSSDRWALQFFSVSSMVGEYALILQLGFMPVTMAVGLITSLIGPILHQRSGDGNDLVRNRNVWLISWWISFLGLGVTLIAFLLALLLHEWIFKLLVPQAYSEVSYMLPWMLLAGGIYAASQVLSLKLMSDLNTQALVIPKVFTSILAVALNFIGAWGWGIHGVVMAQIVFSVSIFAWMALLARKPQLHSIP